MEIHFKRQYQFRLERVILQDGTEFYRPMKLHRFFLFFYFWKTINKNNIEDVCIRKFDNDYLKLSKIEALAIIEQVKKNHLEKFGNRIKNVSITPAELTPFEQSIRELEVAQQEQQFQDSYSEARFFVGPEIHDNSRFIISKTENEDVIEEKKDEPQKNVEILI